MIGTSNHIDQVKEKDNENKIEDKDGDGKYLTTDEEWDARWVAALEIEALAHPRHNTNVYILLPEPRLPSSSKLEL